MPSSVTERDRQLLAMPSLASQFPVSFRNGSSWKDLRCFCLGCDRELPDAVVHGAVVRQTDHMVSVEAIGQCEPCHLLTRFTYRLHDDMRLTGPREHGWVTWTPRLTPWERLVKAVRNLLAPAA